MPTHGKYAAGKYAWGMCDICGVRTRYRSMRSTTVRGKLTGLRVCETCFDPDHPQNFLPWYVSADAQALQNARPDTGLEASRKLYPPGNWPPYPSEQSAKQRFREYEENVR
jgi:hypothetical protein